MAASKTSKKKRGRPPTPRKRLGRAERETVEDLERVIKRTFAFQPGDEHQRETTLNTRLINLLKSVEPRVTNKNIEAIDFIGETYRPECTVSNSRPYALWALECKKLHDHSAKRLFKEGLAQANLYLTRSKIVVLLLYDFTTGRKYKAAFGKGNSISSRFARRARDEIGLYIMVRSP